MSNLSVLAVPYFPAANDHFHLPSIDEFFPQALFFEGTPFEINRIIFIRLVALLALVLVFTLYARRAALVPGRAQNAIEIILTFVRVNIAEEVLGKVLGRKYSPVLSIIFVTILFMNLTGIVPGLNLAGSSVVGFPIVMAAVAYVTFIYAGIKQQGAGHFFKSQLFPAGVPWPLYILLTPIEAFSTFVIRPATLVIRLLANMISGHFILALCFAATNFLVLYASAAYKPIGALTFLAALAFVFFEIFIAGLQAYIFTILTTVYINLSVHAH